MAVDVPPDVVPWKYIKPSPPLDPVIVVLPQKVPVPPAVTVAGRVNTEKLVAAIQPVGNV